MTAKDPNKLERIVAEARRSAAKREQSYREQALKIYPWICGRCGREFAHANLRELTVHHKDHNHQNNPPDGSNWELLCLYCHDHEREKYKLKGYVDGSTQADQPKPSAMANPFENLDALLKAKVSPQSTGGQDEEQM